jgi:hypothetical protein
MYPKTGAAGRIRTPITSLEWNFYVAVSTLVRVDLFKRPSQLDDSGIDWYPLSGSNRENSSF